MDYLELLAFFLILGASLIIVFLPIYLDYKRTKSSWLGIVENKKSKDYYYRGIHNVIYQLYIIKDNGERFTYTVSENVYSDINIGDKVKKEPGEFYPKKY